MPGTHGQLKGPPGGEAAGNREARFSAVRSKRWCTPGMGVNLWGESPLYVNPASVFGTFAQVLAEGKGGTARDRPKEAGAQSDEPTNRNSIQGRVSG